VGPGPGRIVSEKSGVLTMLGAALTDAGGGYCRPHGPVGEPAHMAAGVHVGGCRGAGAFLGPASVLVCIGFLCFSVISIRTRLPAGGRHVGPPTGGSEQDASGGGAGRRRRSCPAQHVNATPSEANKLNDISFEARLLPVPELWNVPVCLAAPPCMDAGGSDRRRRTLVTKVLVAEGGWSEKPCQGPAPSGSAAGLVPRNEAAARAPAWVIEIALSSEALLASFVRSRSASMDASS
jgi:hypothetical protein